MSQAPDTLEGWYVLHDYRSLDWAGLRELPAADRAQVAAEAAAALTEAQSVDSGAGSSALFRNLGHKADLLMLHLRPTLEELSDQETAFARTALAGFTRRTYSYVSITELSLYEATARGGTDDPEKLRDQPFVQRRLYPPMPDMKYVCFYPMNKRRGEQVNWYAADMEERRRMMREHGSTGKKYRERVQQMITGSTGLDDWEWGVTLFAHDPLEIKKLVYEMRFDEVSAKYADFGPFQLSYRITPAELEALLK